MRKHVQPHSSMRYSNSMRGIFALVVAAALFPMMLAAQPAGDDQPAPGGRQQITVPPSVADAQLLRVEDETFTVGEIAAAYNKTLSDDALNFYQLPLDSALGFVNLYSAYRLKVHAAEDAGLNKTSEFLQEMERNRDQVALGATPYGGISNDGYLFQRRLVDPGIKDIWARRGEERKIAVIFTAMNSGDPADTLRAYQRNASMMKMLKQGKDFRILAADSTDDQTTKSRGGVIGWITGGMILRDLEDPAWATPAGEIYPNIIKLQNGYVLLKVMDVDKRVKVRAGHILFEVTKDLQGGDNDEEIRAKAERALARIKAGESFESVAKEVSTDRTTGEQGGDFLSYYTRSLGFESRPGKLAPQFEDALFAMKDGEISDIVPTDYGYHIIKRLDTQSPKLEDEEKSIRDIYKRLFLEEDRQEFTQQVLEKQGFQVNPASFEALMMAIDTTRSAADNAWSAHVTDQLRGRELYRFRGEPVSVGAWIDSVETNPRLRALALTRESVSGSFRTILEYPALKAEAQNLEQEYPSFGRLMREFYDGSLIFALEQERIYDKIGFNDEDGRKYFEQHRDDYKNPPQLALTEIFIYTESNAKSLYGRAQKGEDFSELATKYTERQGYREKAGTWPMNSPKHSELVRKVLEIDPNPKAGTILKPMEYQGAWSIVRIDEIEPATKQSYEEARSEVMADYNDWREKTLRANMVASFREKYSTSVDKKALEKALSYN